MRVARMAEKVVSMDEDQLVLINKMIGETLSLVCAGDVSWSLRPRLYWKDWELTASEEDYRCTPGVHKSRVDLFAYWPACSTWLDRGATFEQEGRGGRLPTFTRA